MSTNTGSIIGCSSEVVPSAGPREMGLPNEYCPTMGSTRAVVALLGAAGGAEYGVLSRTACLQRVLFGVRAEWGCGSRPADVLCKLLELRTLQTVADNLDLRGSGTSR